MRPIKKILVPTDFSPAAESAFGEAVGLARTLGASVTLLNVYELPQPVADAGFVCGSDVIDGLEAAAREQLERTRSVLRDTIAECPPLDIKAVLGVAHEEIVAEARRGGYDLIVMATHGRTGVKHLLVGSVAERVVRLSSVPVLTVHPTAERETSVAARTPA